MKRLTSALLIFAAVLSIIGCEHKLNIPLEDIDVDFVIPSAINLEPGTQTIDFEVRNGKAPLPDDLIILNGPRGQFYCKIIATSQESFTIELYDNFANGEHSIIIQRGLSTEPMGTTIINLERYDDGVHPESGSTVYGRVSCDGEPIAGVVVSDGIDVLPVK